MSKAAFLENVRLPNQIAAAASNLRQPVDQEDESNTPSIVGDEFLVNTETQSEQYGWSVIQLESGNFLAVWTSYDDDVVLDGARTSGGPGAGVAARLFSSDGTPIGNEFNVTGDAPGFSIWSKAVALPSGGFVVVWESNNRPSSNIDVDMVFQVFDADGEKVGDSVLFSEDIGVSQGGHAITILSNGNFVITWTEATNDSLNYPFTEVYGQVFSADGTAVSSKFVVTSGEYYKPDKPAIAALENGQFVIAWNTGDSTVSAQIFNSDGSKDGDEFLASTGHAYLERSPSVAALDDGSFVVVWDGRDNSWSSSEIHARMFSSDGDTIGDAFQVNTHTDGSQSGANVAALEGGGFFVTWTNHGDGGDGDSTAVSAQFFDSTGAKIGTEFVVNQETESTQFNAVSTDLGDNQLAVIWSSRDPDVEGEGSAVAGAILTYDYPSVLSGDFTGSVEEGDVGDKPVTASGTISISDADASDSPSFANVGATTGDNGYGSFTLVNGTWTYTLDQSAVQELAEGDSVTDKITFSASDGTSQEITVTINGTDETVFAGTDQNDTIVGSDNDEEFSGGLGDDQINAGRGDDRLEGEAGEDTLWGNEGSDTLSGGADNDTLNGGDGSDNLDGGTGNDVLNGDTGDDTLDGGGANDLLRGGFGHDLMQGSGGNDVLYGDVGNDTLNGGAGYDTASYFESAAAVITDLGSGGISGQAKGDIYLDIEHVTGSKRSDLITGDNNDNRLKGMDGWDTLYGAGGNDTLEGGGGHDVIDGGEGDDLLTGGSKRDNLMGGSGADTIDGGTGQDTLTGGAGDDILAGGAHKDTFVFASGSGNDQITDFHLGLDVLDLSKSSTDFSDLASVIAVSTETAGGLLIDLGGGDSVLLVGIGINDLSSDNINF